MPIELIAGPANAGKAQAVLATVRTHLAHGVEPWLIVPTEADEALYRRELAETGAGLGVRVERFEGLLAEVVARAGGARPLLGPLAREWALASIAKEVLGRDEDLVGGFAAALAALVAELHEARVSPTALSEAVSRWEDRPEPVARLCEIFAAYRDLLARGRRVDRELRATQALDALRRTPALWGASPVALYGFDSFTELELDAIETLGTVVDAPLTVSLAYEPGRAALAGRAEWFERLRPLARAHTSLGARPEHYEPGSRAALGHLERSLFEPAPERLSPGAAVRLLEGASPRAELELVAGEARALLDEGAKPEEIAIVHRAPATVAGLLAEVLDDFAVPHSIRSARRVSQTALGAALLGLMSCAGPDGRLGDLLAWLRSPGVLDRVELADRLEASALRRGVRRAAEARRLWEAEHWPLDRLRRLERAAEEGPRRLVAALRAELQALFCAPRRGTAALLGEHELQEAHALTALQGALDELGELARNEPTMAPDLEQLQALLGELALGAPERPAPGKVLFCDPLSLRARRVGALFLCGLQEGVFPAPPPSQPLLGDEDRRALARATGIVLPRTRDWLAAERYLLYATCSRPYERLAVSWHTAEEDGAPVAPSLFLDDVRDLFDERLAVERRSAGAVAWPGPGEPAGAMAARIAAAAGDGAAMAGGGGLEEPLAPLRDGAVLDELRGRQVWSASALETWAACPVRWLVERLLRLESLEADPEPLLRGALAHAVLRQTLELMRERHGSTRLTPASLAEAKRLLDESLAQQAERHLATLSPERALPLRRRLQADLERYLEHAAAAHGPLEPTHLELAFGFEDDGPGELPALELEEGVRVRGRIDRVDLGADGQAVVYDYKGASATPGARWASERKLQVALYIAAAERLLGLDVVGGFYQPLAAKDLRARGLLDGDVGLELDCVRTDRLPGEEVAETLAQCRAVALATVAEARAGRIEPRPRTCGYDGGCAYPEICRCER